MGEYPEQSPFEMKLSEAMSSERLIPGGSFRCKQDADWTLIEANKSFYRFVGYGKEELARLFDNKLLRMIYAEDVAPVNHMIREQLKNGTTVVSECRIVCKNGAVKWIWISSELVAQQEGPVFYCIFMDISERKKTQEQLALSEQRYEYILSQTQDIIFEWNYQTKTIYNSPNFQRKFGYDLQGGNFPFCVVENGYVHPEDVPAFLDLYTQYNKGVLSTDGEFRLKRADGQYIWCRSHSAGVFDKDGVLLKVLGMLYDIESFKQELSQISEQAKRDPLTGLYNKAATEDVVQQALWNRVTPAVLMIVDVDNFKQINDTFGHVFGDAVLSEISHSLKDLFAGDAILGRVGGDEFVVFLPDVRSMEQMSAKARMVSEVFQRSFQEKRSNYVISGSIGVARFPQDGLSYLELFEKADLAMYLSKKNGKNRFAVYDPALAQAGKGLRLRKHREENVQPETKGFRENMAEYVFRIFVENPDPEKAIPMLFDLIGTTLELDRIFILERTHQTNTMRNTFEWCNTGIEPLRETNPILEVCEQSSLYMGPYQHSKLFDNISALPDGREKEWLLSRGTHSVLFCRVSDFFRRFALIGFELCSEKNSFVEEDCTQLTLVAQTIGLFLMKTRAAQQLVQYRLFTKNLLQRMGGSTYIVDPKTYQLRFFTDKKEDRAQFSLKALCYQYIRGYDAPCPDCPMKELTEQQPVIVKELYYPKEKIWTETTASMIEWNTGAPMCLISSYNVTRLRADAKRFDFLDRNIPGGMMGGYLEKGYPFYFINHHMLRYLGYQRESEFIEDIQGKIINCIHPQDRASVYHALECQLAQSDEYATTYRMRTRDGSYIWVYDKGKRIVAENGKEAIISVCFDVSEEEELKLQLSLYRATERGGVITVRIDPGFTLIYANDIFLDLHGYTAEELRTTLGNRCAELIHPDDLPRVKELCATAVLKGIRKTEWEMRVITGKGEIRYVLINAVFTEIGGLPAMNVLVLDITEHHQLREKISKSEERYRIGLEYAKIKVWEYDIPNRRVIGMGHVQYYYHLGEELDNIPEDYIQKGYVHPESAKDYRRISERLHASEQQVAANIRFKFPDREEYWWERISYTTVFDSQGKPLRAIAVGEEITQQKEAEIRYQQELEVQRESAQNVLASSKADLNEDKVEFMQMLGRTISMPSMSYEQLFEIGFNTIANEDDRKRYTAILSREALLRAFNRLEKAAIVQYRRKDAAGRLIWVEAIARLVPDAVNGHVIAYGTIRDINEQKNIELNLKQRAERDPLTGVYNRETALMMMHNAAERSRVKRQSYFVLLFDVDHFSALTEQNGYTEPEDLIWELGEMLHNRFSVSKIIGRPQKDQFLIYISDDYSERKKIQRTAEEICKAFSMLPFLPNAKMPTTVSVGTSLSETGEDPFDLILDQAKTALGVAKAEGGNKCVLYASKVHSVQAVALPDSRAVGGEILLQCVLAILSAKDKRQVLFTVLKIITQYFRGQETFLVEKQDETSFFYQWPATYHTNGQPKGLEFTLSQSQSAFLEALSAPEAGQGKELIELSGSFPELCRNMLKRDIHLVCAVRMIAQDETMGYLAVCNPSAQAEELKKLRTVGDFLANDLFRRRLQAKQAFLTWHDALTGLLNRNSYLKYRRKLSEETLISMGILSVDINGLKKVNLQYGYSYGDDLIRYTGTLLLTKFGPVGRVYRFSGDEFLAICENITKEAFANLVAQTREESERTFPNSLSAGHVWADRDIDMDTLISLADERMVLAKQDYYESANVKTKRHDPFQVKELVQLIKDGCFSIYLQPKAEIQSDRIIGAEALVRLQHPAYGFLPPSKFVARSEETGTIRYIDLFVFEEVCRTLENWRIQGIAPFTISLNFSRSTILSEDLLLKMRRISAKYKVPHEWIEIEITESIGEVERETIAEIGREIVLEGFRLSLDDFGARYSNLSVLSAMQLNAVKLDKSLINDLLSNQATRIIVANFIQTCKQLQIESVAEGVETEEQLCILRKMGCDIAQGYYFNKPIPVEYFEEKYF